MIDEELLGSFVVETRDLLDEVEPQLIELQTDTEVNGAVDIETLNAIFRLFHSMKGSAGYFGLETITNVTHQAETLLEVFRQGRATLGPDHTDLLCRTLDFIRGLLDQVEANQNDAGYEEVAQTYIDEFEAATAALRGSGTAKVVLPPSPRRPVSTATPDKGASDAEALPIDNVVLEITPEMRQTFVQEANELIEEVEHRLLELETAFGQKQADAVASAFRAMHSFKGSCGFMGLADMQNLAHHVETVLDCMKSNAVPIDQSNVAVLLSLVDTFRESISTVTDSGGGKVENCDIFLSLIGEMVLPEGAVLPATFSSAPALTPVAPKPSLGPGAASTSPPAETIPTPAQRAIEGELSETPLPDARPIPKRDAMPKSSSAKSATGQSIRVDLAKLDALINLVGELAIAEAMVTRHPLVSDAENEGLERAVHLLRRVSSDLQDTAMSARMIPLTTTFRKMIRLVHDLAAKSGKAIDLQLLGEDTEVDKTVIENIADPLVHLVRNAADHGIEPPGLRATTNKPETATITIEGRHEGGEVWILVSDDGRGLNTEEILTKAIEKGLVSDDADLTDDQVLKLIFEPGFSTAEEVTDVSGRGVGMDVVKKNLEKMKGRIDIRSRRGEGSTFVLRIPLTLAVIDGMLVRVGDARYTIPLLTIRESFRPRADQLATTPDGIEMVRVRDDFYPVVRLHERFRRTPDSSSLDEGIVVLVEGEGEITALFVDEIVGQQETVIKGLSDFLGDSHGVSGCTILGDGEVSLILDIAGLVEAGGRS